jgi:very-short-patch-repair endonuclease
MERCRAENIARALKSDPTKNALAALREFGIRPDMEVVTWFDGDRFVLSDLMCQGIRKAIELQGAQHKDEVLRDEDKAAIVKAKWGYETIFIWNGETEKPDYTARLRRKLGLHCR